MTGDMKVLALNGSARIDGNTSLLIRTVCEELEREGINTHTVQLSCSQIAPCKGCFACQGLKNCAFMNDGFADLFTKMTEADGIVLGSPVYSADVSGIMKVFLERAGVVAATNPGLFRHKAGVAVAAVRRAGGLTAIDTMNHFFLNKEMYLVGSTYWNMAYGKDIGDVLNDREGMDNMRNLGRNMAFLLKRLVSSE